MISILLFLFGCYALLLCVVMYGFYKTSRTTIANVTPIPFSIIIPFRNEEQHLKPLLESLVNLEYPLDCVSFYFVNDASTDKSESIVQRYANSIPNLHLIDNKRTTKSPKKDAITTAIANINSSWIITLDADCVVPKHWLMAYASYIKQDPEAQMVIGPVSYFSTASFLAQFQLIDFLSLQLFTIGTFGIGKPILCNGANLAYQKNAFIEVQGFQGNESIASGDDIFLLEKLVKKNSKVVGLLKNPLATVYTYPQTNFKKLFEQRKRWAGKTSKTKNKYTLWIGVVIFITNVAFIGSLIGYCVNQNIQYLLFLLSKIILDLVFLNVVTRYYKEKLTLISRIGSSFLYPFFMLYISVISMFSSYVWKERSFRK